METWMMAARTRARLGHDFYSKVEAHFVNSTLVMFLVNGLAASLKWTIATNDALIEEDDTLGVIVVHIGSIKLKVENVSSIEVTLSAHDELKKASFSRALLISICQRGADEMLTAEVTMITPLRDACEFAIALPETPGHALTTMLVELKKVVSLSTAETLPANLKTWAAS